jgi:hypothetical protein
MNQTASENSFLLDPTMVEALKYRRRLSDKIMVAFAHACEDGDLSIADQLLKTLESLLSRNFDVPGHDRRKAVETLVGASSWLWHLKQQGPEAFPSRENRAKPAA